MKPINTTRILHNVTLNEEADLDEERHGNDGKDDENTDDADVGQDGHDTQASEHMFFNPSTQSAPSPACGQVRLSVSDVKHEDGQAGVSRSKQRLGRSSH